MKRRLIIVLCLFTAVATFAEEAQIPKESDHLAGRYAEATAYFELVVEALQKSGKEHANFKTVRDDAMFYSLLLASVGRTQEIAVKVTNARIELSKKEMLKEMNHRNENIAIIMNKYGEASIGLVKNPPKEVLELLDKHAREIARDRKNALGPDAKEN